MNLVGPLNNQLRPKKHSGSFMSGLNSKHFLVHQVEAERVSDKRAASR